MRHLGITLGFLGSLLCVAVGWAGSVAPITVEAPMRPVTAPVVVSSPSPVCTESVQDYWTRYPDVATLWQPHTLDGAYSHYTQHGISEGRTWNGALCGAPPPPTTGGGTPLILAGPGWTPSHGTNAVLFPNGATLGGFSWQSVVKTGNSEVLAALKLSVPGQQEQELVRMHHWGVSNPAPTVVLLPEAILLPPGSIVWCYADGWGDPHPAGFECQATLYLLGNPAWSVQ